MLGPQINWQPFYYSANDGLKLHGRDYGSRQLPGVPLVCLPGLTRSARDFHDLATYVSSHLTHPRRVVCFDYRGRGGSEYDPHWQNYNPSRELDDILTGMTAAGIGHAAILGTSRGGLITMLMAAVRPAVMAAAILNDIGPVVEGKGLARIKGYVTRDPHIPRSWDAAAEAVKRINGVHFPDLEPQDWLRFARQTFDDHEGKPTLAYDSNLARTIEGLDINQAVPTLWPQFEALAGLPTLVLRGENSDILSADALAEMADRHPDLQTLVVPKQGHAPLIWDQVSQEAIATFLGQCDG